mgnify:CR=1 FL=1
MADTIGGGINEDGSLQNTIVIDEADSGKIDIVRLENAQVTEVAVNSPIKDLQLGLKGDNDIAIAGERLVDAVITNEAPAGETVGFTLTVTKAKSLEFVTTGKGTTGSFAKPATRQSSIDCLRAGAFRIVSIPAS